MQLQEIFKSIIKKIDTIVKNNPLLPLSLIFFFALFLINNIIISTIKYPPSEKKEFILFPGFETLEEKYKYQTKIFKKLKKLDYNFHIHSIEKGENYWGIAKTNQIDIDTIVGLNPYLNNFWAGIGEKLIVCNKQGCLHIIRKNENIYSIAKEYNQPVNKIEKANRRNIFKKLFSPLKEGDILFIPNADPKILTEGMKKLYEYRYALQSPLGGRYTSGYGTRMHPILKKRKFHYGLDIKTYVGQPVGSSEAGIVEIAGWVGGYGKYVKIRHFNGYSTSYGHLSRIYVKRGQKVQKGQIIGRAGNTGRSTGPHLDFRVWYKNKPMDPTLFLW